MSQTRFAAAVLIGMSPLTAVYVSFCPMVCVSRSVAWAGVAAVLVLSFALPRWIEKYDLLGMSR